MSIFGSRADLEHQVVQQEQRLLILIGPTAKCLGAACAASRLISCWTHDHCQRPKGAPLHMHRCAAAAARPKRHALYEVTGSKEYKIVPGARPAVLEGRVEDGTRRRNRFGGRGSAAQGGARGLGFAHRRVE